MQLRSETFVPQMSGNSSNKQNGANANGNENANVAHSNDAPMPERRIDNSQPIQSPVGPMNETSNTISHGLLSGYTPSTAQDVEVCTGGILPTPNISILPQSTQSTFPMATSTFVTNMTTTQGIGQVPSLGNVQSQWPIQNLSGPVFPEMSRSMPENIVGPTQHTLATVRQQMDESNHDMVHMITQQMNTVIQPLIESTNNTCNTLARQVGRLTEVLGGEGQQDNLGNGGVGEIPVPFNQGQPNPELQYGNVHILGRNQEENYIGIGPQRVRQNNFGGHLNQYNINQVVEQILNRFGFNNGYANQPYFVSAFPEWIQQVEMPTGLKPPKFTKFSGESGESTVEHIARYTLELGELESNEYLKMRFFPSSLTKNAFSWFSTLRPNSVHSWAQLERSFHDQFFRGELRVNLIDLFNVKRMVDESIDDYLSRFRQMKSRCFTPILEAETLKMAISGLDYPIRKKLVNQQFLDMAQLADKVRQIEQLKAEKNERNKKIYKEGKDSLCRM